LLVSITADLGIIGVIPCGLRETYVNQHIALVRIDPARASARWVGHYMAAPMAQQQIRRLDDPGAKAGLNLPTVRSLKCALPSRKEQDAISARIDSLDQRIVQEGETGTKFALVKDGLMEDLLTGRVRVTALLERAAE
jgi:type I restriction enzyme S subunit